GFFAHAGRVPRGIEDHVDGDVLDAFYAAGSVFHPAGHFAGNRTAGSGQGHVDGEVAVVVEVDLVDQAQLIDIDRDFRVIDSLERTDQLGGDALDLTFRKRGRHGGRDANVFRR